jgi:hypothetical protein
MHTSLHTEDLWLWGNLLVGPVEVVSLGVLFCVESADIGWCLLSVYEKYHHSDNNYIKTKNYPTHRLECKFPKLLEACSFNLMIRLLPLHLQR